MVKVYSDPRYKINKKIIKKTSSQILIKRGIDEDYLLNIAFVGARKMKLYAKDYKKENVVLPVLSFSYLNQKKKSSEVPEIPGEEKLLGEIVICYPQALLLAAERNKSVNNMLTALIEHGVENIINN